MTDKDAAGPMRSPSSTRFRKGQSGNPAGRPRKVAAAPPASAFDVVIDRTLTITQGGSQREMTVDEALQHKTYQAAVGGDRAACREVMGMIAKREKALPQPSLPTRQGSSGLRFETDPANADQALLILGIAGLDPRWEREGRGDEQRLRLEPWAVQAALRRRGRKPLTERAVRDVDLCTRDAGTLVWPKERRR